MRGIFSLRHLPGPWKRAWSTTLRRVGFVAPLIGHLQAINEPPPRVGLQAVRLGLGEGPQPRVDCRPQCEGCSLSEKAAVTISPPQC